MKNIKIAMKAIILSSILCTTLAVPAFADIRTNQNVLIEIERYAQPNGGWQPGDSRNVKLVIKNNTDMNMKIDKIYMIEKSRLTLDEAFDEMAKNTWITIKDGNTTMKESIKLKDFLASDSNNSVSALENYIRLSPGQIKELTMSIDMKEGMGNQAQSLSKVFSLGTVYSLTSTGGGDIVIPEEPSEPENPGGGDIIIPEEPSEPENPGGGEVIEPEKPDPDNGGNSGSGGDTGSGNGPNNGSNVGGSEDKLPQTGGIVNGATFTVLGVAVAGLGIVLDRKSSDKGGKSNE